MKSPRQKSSPYRFQSALVVLGFSLLLVLYSWWQISPSTFQEFDTICRANSYDSCMRFYWQQKSYYQVVLNISLLVTFGSALASLYFFKHDHR